MKLEEINQDIPFVNKENFKLLFPSIKYSSFSQNIKNWIKKGKIIHLKRGLYVFSKYWEKCQDKDNYLNYVSSILYNPSYISKETVLSKYGMLSESVFGISCVTSKTRRIFTTEIAVFDYSKIKDELFTGFEIKFFGNNKYYVATKAKALFDYLYFYKRRLKRINDKAIEELRLNLENMNSNDFKEFENYLKIAGSAKLNKICNIIKKTCLLNK